MLQTACLNRCATHLVHSGLSRGSGMSSISQVLLDLVRRSHHMLAKSLYINASRAIFTKSKVLSSRVLFPHGTDTDYSYYLFPLLHFLTNRSVILSLYISKNDTLTKNRSLFVAVLRISTMTILPNSFIPINRNKRGDNRCAVAALAYS